MDADGANPTRLIGGGSPAWSPNGLQIAFTGGNGIGSDIFIVDVSGNNLRRLTAKRIDQNIFPAWSPDGKKIAFVSNRGKNWDLFVITADGKNPKNLTWDLLQEDRPSWSPDGRRIAYSASPKPGLWFATFNIYVMNADGTNPVMLTEERRWASESRPKWSADGRKIVFSSRELDGTHDIYTINSDGSDLRNLAQTPHVNDLSPAWRPGAYSVSAVGKLATRRGRVKRRK